MVIDWLVYANCWVKLLVVCVLYIDGLFLFDFVELCLWCIRVYHASPPLLFPLIRLLFLYRRIITNCFIAMLTFMN